MNAERYIKQAVIAALCEHPDLEKYKSKVFSNDNLTVLADALAQQGQRISKQDLFTPDDDGRYIIDTPGFFKNYQKICALLSKNNESMGLDDYMRPLKKDGTRNMIDAACEARALGQVFAADQWKGRYDEMERLWFKFPLSPRREFGGNDGCVNLQLKRTLLAVEGRVAVEDSLLHAGLSARDILTMFDDKGNYEFILSKLAQGQDFLRKEYLLLTDVSGNTVFQKHAAWERYDDICKHLEKNGQRFEVADFTRQIGYTQTILGRAAEARSLHRIFTPAYWVGRLDDMLHLWSRVLDGWKMVPMTSQHFDECYAQAESDSYPGAFNPASFTSKQQLLQPVDRNVLPLGLKSFWDAFPTVQQKLNNMNTPLTLADLRQKSGGQGHTILVTAIKLGHFQDVVSILRHSNEKLSPEDFLTKDSHGNTLLNVMADRKQLSQVFAPELWVGRLPEMKRLWNYTRVADRDQVNIQQYEVVVKQATLRQGFKSKFDF
jgi:hypothetical protein